MANCNLAVILYHSISNEEVLVVKQKRPPVLGKDEYNCYVDSDLWDLPSTPLELLQGDCQPGNLFDGIEVNFEDVDLKCYDVESAIDRVLGDLGFCSGDVGEWRFLKQVKEPNFGPGLPFRTVFVTGKHLAAKQKLQEQCKWMSVEASLNYLVEVKPSDDRVGPLLVLGLANDSLQSVKQKLTRSMHYQEYPPGVMLVPMLSKTAKPFSTTNLVMFAPEKDREDYQDCDFFACGDALIIDPGCRHKDHEELKKLVAALPRKLIVLVTHHHHDHIDGLSVVQACNPGAILLAHEKTRHRIGKEWSHGYKAVSGGEDICVRGQRLKVIFAPGHTDGHIAVLHVSTHSLIVGDHCVGQGSALLDITSGGNMMEYFQSTYKFLDLSPHVLIPMHGRVNLWPKNMLCRYLKNRRSREASIVNAIEHGSKTLFDIVAKIYSNVDIMLWFAAASNVRLHIDHLAQQNKLPKEFSSQVFQKSCLLPFLCRWIMAYIGSRSPFKYLNLGAAKLLVAGAVAACSVLYLVKKNPFKLIYSGYVFAHRNSGA